MKTVIRIFTVIILLFLSLGGLYGGWTLIDDPGGTKLGLSVDLLVETPFRDFLVPGIILWLFNGLLPLFIVFFVLFRARNHGWFVILQGGILFIWLTTALVLSTELYSSIFHPVFYVVAGLLIFSGKLILKKTQTD